MANDNKITALEIKSYDNYGMVTQMTPYQTVIKVIINNEEYQEAVYPLNPTIETFLNISNEFLKRVENGTVNQRKIAMAPNPKKKPPKKSVYPKRKKKKKQ